MAHSFNPSTLGGRGRLISEFYANLFYRASSRTARVTQRNPVSKQNQTNQKQKQTNKKTKYKTLVNWGQNHSEQKHMARVSPRNEV